MSFMYDCELCGCVHACIHFISFFLNNVYLNIRNIAEFAFHLVMYNQMLQVEEELTLETKETSKHWDLNIVKIKEEEKK